MILRQGNMYDHFHRADHFIICSHSTLAADGTLPLTSKQGQQLSAAHPDLPAVIGEWLKTKVTSGGTFGLRIAGKVGLFQNMTNPKLGTSLGLISAAAKSLKQYAEANSGKVILLECPRGSDPYFTIEGLMRQLPDNVEVWDATH